MESAKKPEKSAFEEQSKDLTELEVLHQQNTEYLETLQRLQAEFENYQKRTAQEKLTTLKYAAAPVLFKFLDLIDLLDHALLSFEQSDLPDEHVEGLRMIHQRFLKLLEEEGVRPLETVGEPFDNSYHEVLRKIHSEKPEGIILEEIQKGYKYHDKVLRHAKVVISSGQIHP